MNYKFKNTKDNNLYVAEIDPLLSNIDIDEITAGINRSLEDIKYNNTTTKNNDLYVAEDSLSFNLDYDEIHEGILRGEEDIRCGRCFDLKTGMARLKRMLLDE